MSEIEKLVRENIRNLKPYSSARSEFKGKAEIFLDANENAMGSPYEKQLNRYPDPLQSRLKQKISEMKGIAPERMFLGNGSDEAIDLIMRCFCEPRRDQIMVLPPTYGMYQVSAAVNDVNVKEIPLRPDFQLDLDAIKQELTPAVKLIFVCSPNNPSGNMIDLDDVEKLLKIAPGLVVVDEAYIDFTTKKGILPHLNQHKNLVVFQTLSKAWGMASIRLGIAFADPGIITYMNNVKPPYNINGLTQDAALQVLQRSTQKETMVSALIEQRLILESELAKLKITETVFPSDANFLLVRFYGKYNVYQRMVDQGIILRDRSKMIHCENCLRITVGSPEENSRLIESLKKLEL